MNKRKKKQSLQLYHGEVENILFKPLIFIDFEYTTTSYRRQGQRKHIQEIIEVAFISISEDGSFKYDTIIKPKIYLEQLNKSFISKLSNEDIGRGKDLSDFISLFRDFYKPGVTKIIAWGGTDLFTINYLCKTYGIQFHIRKDDYIDLSQKFRRFYNLNQAITLEKALCKLGIKEKYEKHRAMPDTEMLLSLFNTMVVDGYVDEELISIN